MLEYDTAPIRDLDKGLLTADTVLGGGVCK